MKLTDGQRAAIEHRGSSLIVAASAGSGKTEVLAQRCVSLIADPKHPCGVDRFLVVTFTRAAAAELRARVGKMLRQASGQQRDRRLHDHLRRQELLLDTADIGTIDAWCARLVREHFAADKSGIDPAFTVLSEEQAALLRRAAIDDLFDWICRADDELAEAARQWIRRHAWPNDDFLREMVLELNRYREHLINPRQWFARQLDLHNRDEAEIRADAARLLAGALASECEFQLDQLGEVIATVASGEVQSQLQAYRDALAACQGSLADATQLAAAVADLTAFKFARKPRGVSERDLALREEVKQRWFEKRLKKRWGGEWVEEVINHAGQTAELTITLLRLEERFRALLEERKHARRVCEFGDVLRMALDLLGTPAAGPSREPTPVAMHLQRRYEHILVDEYQDTSPVQVELLRLVTRSDPGHSNRFMVGDIKQSIYGFREAEPRLFADLIEAFSQGREEGDRQPLSDNFRSHHELVEGLNRLFTTLFDPALGGAAYGDQERLCAQRDEIANPTLDAQPRTELHLVFEESERGEESEPADTGDELPLERIDREGRIAARCIRSLLDAGVQVPQRDSDESTTTLRPLRLSDIVILLRSAKGNAPRLAGVLRNAQIPCVAAGRESLLDSTEVRDMRCALTLLVNRQQDVPLAAYLRGPMAGLSESELLQVRRAAPGASFATAVETYRAAGSGRELKTKLDGAIEQLDRWTAAARTLELPVLLRQILRETEYVCFVQALPGAEHRVAMLSALDSLAVDFAARGQQGVAEFVEHLDALEQHDLRPTATATISEDTVRIMTIHAAKGLEFPFVFLLAAGTDFGRRSTRGGLQCDEQRGVGFQFFDYPARTRLVSPAFEPNRQALTQRELEEELRLLYVAATRARERLVIVGHTPESTWDDLLNRYTDGKTAPPLISRLSARSMLEWVMTGVAANQLHQPHGGSLPFVRVETHAGEIPAPERPKVESAPKCAERVDTASADDRWIERGHTWIEQSPDTRLARLPAVLSVSALKEQRTRLGGEDVPRDLDLTAALREPEFARTGTQNGRVVGNAYHRFMQYADPTRFDSPSDVRRQLEELVADRQLPPEEAELISVEDLVWFATSDEGQLLARHANSCKREVPFVWSLPIAGGDERTVLRGVIDCLLETDNGLLILDYKTDRKRDRRTWPQRIDAYKTQLGLYASAAAEIFAREVTGASLVFLRERELLPVGVDHTTLDTLRVRLNLLGATSDETLTRP